MGEIADDCFDRAMDELEEINLNPDGLLAQRYFDSRSSERAPEVREQLCFHRFRVGRCPNPGCSGNSRELLPF